MTAHGIVAVTPPGVNAQTATDPNQFVFHSDYNTLKIIATGTVDITVPANSSYTDYPVAHNQESRPFVLAFLREDSLNAVIFNNNTDGLSYHIGFGNIQVDYQYIYFRLSNSDVGSSHVAHIRYYIFEVPLY